VAPATTENSVRTPPGQSAVTVTPLAASSPWSDSANEVIAALVAA
jgi:hypothetical protein